MIVGTNLATSLIRTWTPILVGTLISWLASLGINVDDQTKGSLVVVLTALFIGLYYTVVRLLERQYPKLGMLLGAPAQPVYLPKSMTTTPSNPVTGTPPAPPAV